MIKKTKNKTKVTTEQKTHKQNALKFSERNAYKQNFLFIYLIIEKNVQAVNFSN